MNHCWRVGLDNVVKNEVDDNQKILVEQCVAIIQLRVYKDKTKEDKVEWRRKRNKVTTVRQLP